jgi:nucleoside-diphosphate-sugar epimerase
MDVLVTGAGGFIGGYVIDRLLARGYRVRHFGRAPRPELAARGIRVYTGDLADVPALLPAMEGVEAVFHIAAKAGIWGAQNAFYKTNVLGTQAVINACKHARVAHLVYTSTPSVVFNRGPFRGEDESLPYGRNWLCHYAWTKAEAEKAVLSAHNPGGLKTIALRPHLVWGPGDPHILPRIIARAKAGHLRIIGDGKNRVDISYVENVADAHLCALDALQQGRTGGKAYFISQGEPVALWPWINSLLQQLDIPPVKRQISLSAAYRLGAIAETVWSVLRLRSEPPMTRFVATELGKDHFFNTAAARRELGYDPAINTEEGIKKTLAWLRKEPFFGHETGT